MLADPAAEEASAVAINIERRRVATIHPLHAALLSATLPLFIGAALGDAAYMATYHIAWKNFASWLNLGGLLVGAIAFVVAVVDLLRSDRRTRSLAVSTLALLLAWVVGVFNALTHARDAWASMPTGLVLSIVVSVLALAATWFGLRAPYVGEAS